MKFVVLIVLLLTFLTMYVTSRTLNVSIVARVEVNTPTGIKMGSSLMKFTYKRPSFPGFFPSYLNNVRRGLQGEAIAVEVSPGRYLFALLGEGGYYTEPDAWLGAVFYPPVISVNRDAGYKRWIGELKRTKTAFPVPERAYPPFVVFSDMNDFTSIQVLEPDDIAAFFGSGTSIKSLTIETTSGAPVFGKVEKLLPWLTTEVVTRLCPPTYQTTGPHCGSISHGDFLMRDF